jgi:hypothetical protein
MCVSGSLKHTVDPHPSIKFPVLINSGPEPWFLTGRDRPAGFIGKGNGFLERGENIGAER